MALAVCIPNAVAASVTADPGSLLTLTFGVTTLTVPGVTLDQTVIAVRATALEAGLYIVGWQITAANTVKIVIFNSSVGTIDAASQTFDVITA